ncbi:hypothetical protein DVB87_24465, partial [Tsukamurella tyrosinosolvens]
MFGDPQEWLRGVPAYLRGHRSHDDVAVMRLHSPCRGSAGQQKPHSPLAASWVKQLGQSFAGRGSGLAGAAAFTDRADGAFAARGAAGVRALTTRPLDAAFAGFTLATRAAAARR